MCFKKIFSLFKNGRLSNKADQPDTDVLEEKIKPETKGVLLNEAYESKETIMNISTCDESQNQIENDPAINQNDKSYKKLVNMNSEEIKESPEFDYLRKLIKYRLDDYFSQEKGYEEENPNPEFDPVHDFPSLDTWSLPWEKFASENDLDQKDKNGKYYKKDELTLLLIGITPHIEPELFDKIIEKKINGSNDFPSIGGVRGKNSRFFLPTGQTALFLIAGDDFARRLQVQQLFGAEHIFWGKKIIWLEDMQNGEPAMHGRLILSPDYIDLLTYGIHKSPQFSISFPAKKIAPVKDEKLKAPTFNDLVISKELTEQINELKSWLKYNDDLMNVFGMKGKLKKGYRTLFYGPPGTGKTFTAEILGNDLKRDVFKIDLSMIVSKYIGETEKNLELLFARAEDKGWILFFDEADALFGKRTNVRDAHDKYANQEVSYLLQRIEDYNGLVILATNMMNNIDQAFIRRFNSILKFTFPDLSQRALIWKKALPKNALFRKKITVGDPPIIIEEPVDIPEMVKKYELTGGSIINVVHYASIKGVEALYEKEVIPESNEFAQANASPCGSIENKSTDDSQEQLTIYLGDVIEGIKRELTKEGKPFAL